MSGSIQIAKLFKIPVLVHWSFLLLFVFVVYEGSSNNFSVVDTLWLGGFMLAIFTCVIMHEFGHALTARRYGVETRDIILLPIGGVARLNKLPEKPLHEFLVAVAGPAVNIAIALLLTPTVFLPSIGLELSPNGAINATNFIPILIATNVFLAVFNLIPAFPMDGGRILRSLLAMRLGRVKATRIASILGQILAVVFVLASIFILSSPILAFIGVFVFMNAWGEYKSVRLNALWDNTKLDSLMKTRFTRLHPHDTMHTAISIVEMGLEKNFVVLNEGGRSIGILHHEFIQEAMKERDGNAPVAVYMSKHYEPMKTTDSLRFAASRIHACGYSIVPVEKEGELVGVLDMPTIQTFLKTRK